MSIGKTTSEILDRQPPFNLEAELNCLGSVLHLPVCIDEVSLVVKPEDFYDDANAKIYRHAVELHGAGKPVDLPLLIERLQKSGDYEVVGGGGYLAKVMISVCTAAHAVYYAEIVREKAILRSIIIASTETLRDAYDASNEPMVVLGRAESAIFAIAERGATAQKSKSFREIMQLAMDSIDARKDVGSGGLRTGFVELDKMLGGLKPGELTIVAGRPSMGKTALGVNFAEYVAGKDEIVTLIMSLEMSAERLAERMLCAQGSIDSYRLGIGNTNNEERQRLVEEFARLARWPVEIEDGSSLGVTAIAAHCRRTKRRRGLGLVVVDYLQLIDPDNSRDPRQEQVAKISRRLKLLAKELSVPIVCLSQLNRQTESAKDNKPKLSHLRESGAIEQDADVVIFCHRPAYYTNATVPPGSSEEALLIVAKNRNGPTGEIPVLWFPSYTRFSNVAKEGDWRSSRSTGDGDAAPKKNEYLENYNERKDLF